MAVLAKYRLSTPRLNDLIIRNVWEIYNEHEDGTDEKKIADFIDHSYTWYGEYTLYKILSHIHSSIRTGGCLHYRIYTDGREGAFRTDYVSVEKLGKVYSDLINEADAQIKKWDMTMNFTSSNVVNIAITDDLGIVAGVYATDTATL